MQINLIFSYVKALEVEDGATWKRGTSETLEITCNGIFSEFTNLYIDGVLIPLDRYNASEGSTVVTLDPELLSTLDAGDHTVTFTYGDIYNELYDSNTASTTIKVLEADDEKKDESEDKTDDTEKKDDSTDTKDDSTDKTDDSSDKKDDSEKKDESTDKKDEVVTPSDKTDPGNGETPNGNGNGNAPAGSGENAPTNGNGNGNANENVKPLPQTGDISNMALYLVTLLGSTGTVAGAGTILGRKFRKRNK